MDNEYYTTENAAVEGREAGTEYEYPEGYDASSYADYYYQQPQDGGERDNYAAHQEQGYEGYYSQETGQGGDTYQYSYDADGYDAYTTTEGREYNYNTGEGYTAEQQTYAVETLETWNYSPEEGEQLYLDQLTTEQTTGYYYDEQGNLIHGYGEAESPTNVFNQEGYWESQESNTAPYTDDTNSPGTGEGIPQDETNTEGLGLTDSPPLDLGTAEGPESVATPDGETPQKAQNKNGRAASPSKKKKSKKERIQQRQALLEKEEDERVKALESAETADANNVKPGDGNAAVPTTSKKKAGFVDREKAKFQLKLRIAKAIRRKRMPVQIRILPKTRKHLSPMDKYFGSASVDCVLSDIFWASIKGDLNRVKHLVEIEGENPTDSKLDPWNLHQTPLHWAAKGGSVPVIKYLLAAGVSPRSLDENGSLPLHLSCWAGHVDASIVLLRASDAKDLYVQDYDGALCPLDWVNVRGYTKLLRAIEKYQDSMWLPKFVDDLVRGIVRYKIKIFKDPLKKPVKAVAEEATNAKTDATEPASIETNKASDKPGESSTKDAEISTKESPTKKSLLTRANTEKVDRKLAKKGKKASSKSLG